VIVPVIVFPPTTDDGDIAIDRVPAGTTLISPASNVFINVTVTISTKFVATLVVVIGNVTDDAPAGTVTVAGTVSIDGMELEIDNTSPLGPTGPMRVTVAVVDRPPTMPEFMDKPPFTIAAPVIVTVADCELDPRVAVMTEDCDVGTTVVIPATSVVVAPTGTIA